MQVAFSDDGEPSRRDHAPAFEENREENEVASLMEISRKLCLVEDPDEEPFRSKYKAREALKKARQILVILHSESGGGGGGAGVSRQGSVDGNRVEGFGLGAPSALGSCVSTGTKICTLRASVPSHFLQVA